MEQIALWTTITAVLFVTFLILLGIGISGKKRGMITFSIIILTVSLAFGAWTVYLFVSKSYNKLSHMLKPRSGMEIYVALFGKTDNTYVAVLHHQDQVIPVMDDAIWLHVKTCPEELERITHAREYTSEMISTRSWVTADGNWFRPETLGDSVIVFTWRNVENPGHTQLIYVSRDSTEMYCKDLL